MATYTIKRKACKPSKALRERAQKKGVRVTVGKKHRVWKSKETLMKDLKKAAKKSASRSGSRRSRRSRYGGISHKSKGVHQTSGGAQRSGVVRRGDNLKNSGHVFASLPYRGLRGGIPFVVRPRWNTPFVGGRAQH